MNNDLISREALKEFINEVCFSKEWAKYRVDYGSRGQIKCILTYIDNAPTVEPCYQTTSCLDCKNYDKENYNCPRFCEVIKEAINSRPQGEWQKVGKFAYECSICGESVCGDFLNFCPNCGAKMKGGAE